MYFIIFMLEVVLECYGEGLLSEIICEGVDFEFFEELRDEEDKG